MVAADLRAGDQVVVEGLQRMRDGVAVKRVGGESEPPDVPVSSDDATGRPPAPEQASAAPDKAG
jgi:hypothetical protein